MDLCVTYVRSENSNDEAPLRTDKSPDDPDESR